MVEDTSSERHRFQLELKLIQIKLAQKLMLRAEAYARAMRARQNVNNTRGVFGCAVRLIGGRGVGERGGERQSRDCLV